MGVAQSFLYQVRRMSLWDSVNRLESRTGVTNPSESPRAMINTAVPGSVRACDGQWHRPSAGDTT